MVNNSTNINQTKDSLNTDGQQFHQYQQTEQSLNTSKRGTTTYDVGNPNPALGEAQKYDGVRYFNVLMYFYD